MDMRFSSPNKAVVLAIATLLTAGCFSAPESRATSTPDVALVTARQTIDAVLFSGNPETPTARPPDVTPDMAEPDMATPSPTVMPSPAATSTLSPTPTPDDGATATVQASVLETAIAATLTAQVTPSPTPQWEATQRAVMETAVAATLTAQATPTSTPNFAATQGALLGTAVAATLTAQPTPTPRPTATGTNTPTTAPIVVSPYADLAANLRQRAQQSWAPATYPAERDRLIEALIDHLDEFQLPNLGITTRTMADALRRGDTGDRVNALVNQVWGDWLAKDVGPGRLDAYRSDPNRATLSPFRQLVIRLIQGRQGALVDNQQHGLYNFFTRSEESHVWVDNVNGVIGAVNRESFLWP